MTETPLSCGSVPQTDFESQFRRVFEAAECRTQVELATLLEIKQSSTSDAKKRKAISAEWLMKLFEKKRINPDWIRYATGAKYLALADAEQSMPHIVRITEIRPPQECSAQELFNGLVRRALQEPDIKAIQKAVADSWLPMRTIDDKP